MDPPQDIDRFFVDGDGNAAAAAGPSWPRVNSSLYPGNSVTYGEVTADGARALAALFQKHSPFSLKKVVFYDLGSGRGRLVLAMAAMFPGIQRSHGIELVKERHNIAIASGGGGGGAPVTFSHGSFLDDDASFPLTDATWVYVSNICFSVEVNAALARKLGRALPPGALVISSKRLDDPELVRVDKATISQTWNSASPVYVYRKRSSVGGASAPVHRSTGDDCSICQDPLEPGSSHPVVRLACGHELHAACAARLILKSSLTPQVDVAERGEFIPHIPVCPLCQHPIDQEAARASGVLVVFPSLRYNEYQPVINKLGVNIQQIKALNADFQVNGNETTADAIRGLEAENERIRLENEEAFDIEGRVAQFEQDLAHKGAEESKEGDGSGGGDERAETLRQLNNIVGPFTSDEEAEGWLVRLRYLMTKYKLTKDAAMSALLEENFAGGARVPVYYVGHASSPLRRRKKYVVVLNNGRRVYFGDPSVADFTKHHDVARRREYLRRHTARAGVETPEFWERWLLWNKPSKRESIRDLERTLRVEIKPMNK